MKTISLKFVIDYFYYSIILFSFQVKNFWLKVLTVEEQSRLVFNIASHLKDAQPYIQSRAVSTYTQ